MKTEHELTLETAIGWIREGKQAVLATVVDTWGSAPRPVGSQLAVSSETEIHGSVSGGCVEGAVVVESLNALEDGRCRILEYGVSNDQAFSVGLTCGGTIKVLVEPIGVGSGPDLEFVEAIRDAVRKRSAIACRTNLSNWNRHLFEPDASESQDIAIDLPKTKASFRFASQVIDDEFVLILDPPPRLIVVGAVHIAQPLLSIARIAGYSTTLIDPRDGFATPVRFPEETIVREWPDDALRSAGLDSHTAVVTLTHDPKLDDPAIMTVLGSDAFYLGCLGSRATHQKRVARLVAAGVPRDQIDTAIHAPVGLDIGGRTPAEIAISIMAEITSRLRHPRASA